jgi:hypothetical protein
MSAKDIIIAAAGGGQTTTPIQYVGGKTVSITPSTSSNTTISLTDLTGSPDPTLLPGDIVIVSYVIGSTTGAGGPNVTSNTYTVISTLESVDGSSTQLYSSYKIMGATPDTSVTVTPTTSTGRGGVVAIQAYRYVDEVFPIQQPDNTATFINTVRPTPPTITPWANDSVAVIVGAGAHTRGNVSYTSTGLTSFITSGSTDATTDSSIGMGFRVIQSGSYSPNQFGFPQSDSGAFSSVALSVALKPKPDTVVPSFISYRAVGLASGNTSTVTLTKPTDVQENDFLLLTISCQGDSQTIVSVPSGFIFVRSQGNTGDSITYLYKKIATASEPASYTIVQSSTSGDISCVISVFRNATTLNTLGSSNSTAVSDASARRITPTVGGLNLAIWMSDGASQLDVPPAGMTELVNFGGTSAGCAQFIYAAIAAPYFETPDRDLSVSSTTLYITRFQLQLTNE